MALEGRPDVIDDCVVECILLNARNDVCKYFGLCNLCVCCRWAVVGCKHASRCGPRQVLGMLACLSTSTSPLAHANHCRSQGSKTADASWSPLSCESWLLQSWWRSGGSTGRGRCACGRTEGEERRTPIRGARHAWEETWPKTTEHHGDWRITILMDKTGMMYDTLKFVTTARWSVRPSLSYFDLCLLPHNIVHKTKTSAILFTISAAIIIIIIEMFN